MYVLGVNNRAEPYGERVIEFKYTAPVASFLIPLKVIVLFDVVGLVYNVGNADVIPEGVE